METLNIINASNVEALPGQWISEEHTWITHTTETKGSAWTGRERQQCMKVRVLENGRLTQRERERGQLSSSPFLSLAWPSVQSVINHPVSPDMAGRCCDTQRPVCACVNMAMVFVWLLVFVFNSSAKYWHVCACQDFYCGLACVCMSTCPKCLCVFERDNMCAWMLAFMAHSFRLPLRGYVQSQWQPGTIGSNDYWHVPNGLLYSEIGRMSEDLSNGRWIL